MGRNRERAIEKLETTTRLKNEAWNIPQIKTIQIEPWTQSG